MVKTSGTNSKQTFSIVTSTNINHKGLQRTANEYAEERRIYKDLISKNNVVDILNSASRILQCWSYYVKLTLQDINTTPKELKTERDCSHRQLFHPFWGSSVWRNNQKALVKNIRALWFKLWLRTLNTHRITPYRVSSGGQESKCQVDVSQTK